MKHTHAHYDHYTLEQMKLLLQHVEGTLWEMPIVLGVLYGMRQSEILGLRWHDVDLENDTFEIAVPLPLDMAETEAGKEMATPKTARRIMPITSFARPFFVKQLTAQKAQRTQAAVDGVTYHDWDLVVSNPDGTLISRSEASAQFRDLLGKLNLQPSSFTHLRYSAAINIDMLANDRQAVDEFLGYTNAKIHVPRQQTGDADLKRQKAVMNLYHRAFEKAAPAQVTEMQNQRGYTVKGRNTL